jgi:hypothetical protein
MTRPDEPGRIAFEIGDRVRKRVGEYAVEGRVVSVFRDDGGYAVIVIADDDGHQYVITPSNLERVS